MTPTTERELTSQGGVLNSLVLLAAKVRSSANEVATAIEGVAWELDRERRGALSAPARQDSFEVLQTIQRLLEEPLLDGAGRAEVRERVLAMLAPDQAKGADQASGS